MSHTSNRSPFLTGLPMVGLAHLECTDQKAQSRAPMACGARPRGQPPACFRMPESPAREGPTVRAGASRIATHAYPIIRPANFQAEKWPGAHIAPGRVAFHMMISTDVNDREDRSSVGVQQRQPGALSQAKESFGARRIERDGGAAGFSEG